MKSTIPYTAPSFRLSDSLGTIHTLEQYRGKWIVLYFYPKDNTPGCTIEACGFRDINDALLAKQAVVIGVSADGGASHDTFRNAYSLNFLLLSDPSHETMQSYGVWGKKMFGREGVLRKTFIIDPKGMVVKVYGRVIPLGHAEQVLADLKQLQQHY